MIRPATAEDAAEIAALYHDIRKDSVPLVHSVHDVAVWIRDVLVIRGTSHVLDLDGVVGWLDVRDGWVDQLYIRRGRTGQGHGKVLLDMAKEACPTGLRLYTFQVNEGARRFYAREGFAEIDFGDGAANEEGQPDVLLQWTPSL